MRVEQIITNQIMEALKKGNIPWSKPWSEIQPQNFVSKREYSGINLFLLSMLDFKDPYFLTFNQVNQLGGSVKKGAKGNIVIYWGLYEDELEDDEKKNYIPFMRYYKVFNIEQCTGIELPKKEPIERKGKCEDVLKTYPEAPAVAFGGNRAYYSLSEDKVVIPHLDRFSNVDEYYATLFHELVHSTGHEKRLNRFTNDVADTIFGSESYSKEELVAELGSAFLCSHFGLDNSRIQKSAGYIQNWLKALKNDSSLVIQASGKARKAKNYILGNKEEKINTKG